MTFLNIIIDFALFFRRLSELENEKPRKNERSFGTLNTYFTFFYYGNDRNGLLGTETFYEFTALFASLTPITIPSLVYKGFVEDGIGRKLSIAMHCELINVSKY